MLEACPKNSMNNILWALFNFCCPELLGGKNWFKEKYESAILHGNEKKMHLIGKNILVQQLQRLSLVHHNCCHLQPWGHTSSGS
ncbi:hypothetical protein ACSBR1_015516 [Camellia fascicularis]